MTRFNPSYPCHKRRDIFLLPFFLLLFVCLEKWKLKSRRFEKIKMLKFLLEGNSWMVEETGYTLLFCLFLTKIRIRSRELFFPSNWSNFEIEMFGFFFLRIFNIKILCLESSKFNCEILKNLLGYFLFTLHNYYSLLLLFFFIVIFWENCECFEAKLILLKKKNIDNPILIIYYFQQIRGNFFNSSKFNKIDITKKDSPLSFKLKIIGFVSIKPDILINHRTLVLSKFNEKRILKNLVDRIESLNRIFGHLPKSQVESFTWWQKGDACYAII